MDYKKKGQRDLGNVLETKARRNAHTNRKTSGSTQISRRKWEFHFGAFLWSPARSNYKKIYLKASWETHSKQYSWFQVGVEAFLSESQNQTSLCLLLYWFLVVITISLSVMGSSRWSVNTANGQKFGLKVQSHSWSNLHKTLSIPYRVWNWIWVKLE